MSLGLCAALTRLGHTIQPLKKGPDYIDPLWLGAASKNTCYNLDFNTMTNDEILYQLAIRSFDKDMVIIEGNKGLYDGTDLEGKNSNAAMAKLTRTPVILVIDAQGVTRGVAPLLIGYQGFDLDLNIAGVIFNKVASNRHERKLIAVTEHYTDLEVIGSVRRAKDLILVERHLGLMPYNESGKASEKINSIADRVKEQVDLDKILDIGKQAKALPSHQYSVDEISNPDKSPLLKMGICRDSLFGFYYADDLEALEQAGVELVTIDTLKDSQLPEIDGLFIGGGFPEIDMQSLSDNVSLRDSIYQAIESGLPTYAECGGLMYLSESISWHDQTFDMVGIIPAKTTMHKKPQGRGYVRLRQTNNMKWPTALSEKIISAHEFHYSILDDSEGELAKKGAFAYAVERGFGMDGKHDGWLYKNLLASYSHMRNTSKYQWAKRFVAFIRKNKAEIN